MTRLTEDELVEELSPNRYYYSNSSRLLTEKEAREGARDIQRSIDRAIVQVERDTEISEWIIKCFQREAVSIYKAGIGLGERKERTKREEKIKKEQEQKSAEENK